MQKENLSVGVSNDHAIKHSSTPRPSAPVGCAVTDVFYLFGKPYVMDLLYALLGAHGRPLRFGDLQVAVPATAGTLSERLKELVAAGLVTRTAFPEIPPRVEYVATPKALRLEPVFAGLTSWARENDLPPAPPSEQRP